MAMSKADQQAHDVTTDKIVEKHFDMEYHERIDEYEFRSAFYYAQARAHYQGGRWNEAKVASMLCDLSLKLEAKATAAYNANSF